MNPRVVLHVEDDQNDVFFLQHAFQQAGISNPIEHAHDGQQAIDYLAGAGKFADRGQYPLPALILLDLKLPRKSGLEVLQWLRDASDLPTLPVIVFSSSSLREDIDRAYHLGANSYIVKPASVEERIELARLIKGFWLGFNVPPTTERAEMPLKA